MPDFSLNSLLPQNGLHVLSLLGLQGQILVFAYAFCRVAAFIALIPGVGEEAVPARIKILIALAATLPIMPFAMNLPAQYPILFVGVIMETCIGFAMGLLVRVIYSSAAMAGSYIATAVGIAGSVFFDPATGGETTAVTRIVVMGALLVVLALNIHHLLIEGLVLSYQLQPFELIQYNVAQAAIEAATRTMEIALRMAAPFIAYGFLFNLSLGLLSRLTPQIQLFFIAQPGNILAGLALIMLILGPVLTFFGEAMITSLQVAIG